MSLLWIEWVPPARLVNDALEISEPKTRRHHTARTRECTRNGLLTLQTWWHQSNDFYFPRHYVTIAQPFQTKRACIQNGLQNDWTMESENTRVLEFFFFFVVLLFSTKWFVLTRLVSKLREMARNELWEEWKPKRKHYTTEPNAARGQTQYRE